MAKKIIEKIEAFYEAFNSNNYEAMASLYHEDATFKDEIFDLKGREIHAMWHMLVARGNDLKVECSKVIVEGDKATAHWVISYIFSLTGRPVTNKITAQFVFKDGLIIEQRDTYDFWLWLSNAFGLIGRVLGWTSWFRKKVQKQARLTLNTFIAANPEYKS